MTILKNLEFFTDHSHNHQIMIDEINSRFNAIWESTNSGFELLDVKSINLDINSMEPITPMNQISCNIEVESPFQPEIRLSFSTRTRTSSYLVIKVYGNVRNVGHKHAYIIVHVPSSTTWMRINFSEIVSMMGWCKIVDADMFTMQQLPSKSTLYRLSWICHRNRSFFTKGRNQRTLFLNSDKMENSLHHYLNRKKYYVGYTTRQRVEVFTTPVFQYDDNIMGPKSPVVPYYKDELGYFYLAPESETLNAIED